MSYYNTTGQIGIALETEQNNAMNMDERIHLIFIAQSVNESMYLLTPHRVHEILTNAGYNYPITSVRRSINTLTKRDVLIKTNLMKTGGYGKPNHCWRLLSTADEHSLQSSNV
jgi:hypothetical protein